MKIDGGTGTFSEGLRERDEADTLPRPLNPKETFFSAPCEKVLWWNSDFQGD